MVLYLSIIGVCVAVIAGVVAPIYSVSFFYALGTAVFAVLSLRGVLSADNVMIIISMVVSFYFGTQHEKSNT